MRKFLDIVSGAVAEAVEVVKAPARKSRLANYLDEVKALSEGATTAVISNIAVREFIDGYITALLWSSNNDEGESLDKTYTEADLSEEAKDRIDADCRSFLHRAGPFLTADRYKGSKLGSLEERAGHDLWFTRVGHGAGFWDGDWEGENEPGGGPLTKAAKALGHVDAYIGDDHKIHLM
jgi:hypothetical protein